MLYGYDSEWSNDADSLNGLQDLPGTSASGPSNKRGTNVNKNSGGTGRTTGAGRGRGRGRGRGGTVTGGSANGRRSSNVLKNTATSQDHAPSKRYTIENCFCW